MGIRNASGALPRLFALGAVAALSCLPAFSADAALGPADAQPPYLVRPGDVLAVSVANEAAYTGSFEVNPTGAITFADEMVKEVPVAGRTVDEVQTDLARRLAEYLTNPQVRVVLRSFRVVVSGSVRSPGEYAVASGATLLQVIDRAGGVSDRQLLTRVFVRSASGDVLRYRPLDFMERGVVSDNPAVQPGDAISVGQPPGGSALDEAISVGEPAAEPALKSDEYEVQGAVKTPGRFALSADQPTSVWEAFRQAGGGTEDADLRRAALRRSDGTSLSIDLGRSDGDPTSPSNPVLSSGDTLFVPRCTTKVNMLGAVARPGEMLVPEGTTLLEAIAKAGGLSASARLGECAIVRQKPQLVRITANLENLLGKGILTNNPVLQDGDTVWVPPAQETRRSTWDRVNETLRDLWFLVLLR